MKVKLITEISFWWILPIITAAFFFTFILYYKDKKLEEFKKIQIWFLASLRFLTFLILFFLLLSPLIKTTTVKVEKPIILFAIDNSKSISYNSDTAKVSALIKNLTQKIQKNFDIKIYSFDTRLYDSLNNLFDGAYTDISNAIVTLNKDYYNRNVGALVLLTDGVYNKGYDPVYYAEQLNFPVYTIALGDTVSYKDLIIKDLTYNKIAFTGNKFPLEIKVAAKKLKNRQAKIRIIYNNNVLAEKNFEINSSDFLQKFYFYIPAEKKGTQKYIVELTKFDDEKNKQNNKKVFAIEVIDTRKKILLLSNSPHPDVAAITRALENNRSYKIEYYLADKFNKNVKEYNLVIFNQLPSLKNNIAKIWEAVLKEKLPYLFIIGGQTDVKKFNTLNTGINIKQKRNLYDEAQGSFNEDFDLFKLDEDFVSIMNQIPPLIVPYGEINIPADANILFYQRIKNIKTLKPLIVLLKENASIGVKSGFVLGEGIWKWRMANYKYLQNQDGFDDMINQIIQYLAINISKQKFNIFVKKIIPENTSVVFKAQLYNENYQPVNDPDVNLKITDTAGNVFEYVFDKTEDFYSLDLGVLPVGDYNYEATTEFNGKKYKQNGKFTIIPVNIEADDLISDYSMLYKLSRKTNGKLLFPDNADSLLFYLKQNPNIKPVSYTTEDITSIIKYKILFFLLVLLLSMEWFFRKFWGSL